VLWWVCLVAAPLVLVAIELFHPAGFTKEPGMYAYLCVSVLLSARLTASQDFDG